jgi:AcrR family transcriptional regulator
MPSGIRNKADLVAEFRTAEIMGAARDVFARKGFSETTMDDIADAAGLAKGTLYLYFKSKRDLYMAALKHGIAELNAQTVRAVDSAKGAREKIRALVSTRLAYTEDNREFCKIYYSELGNLVHPVPTLAEFKKMYMQQVEYMTGVMEQAAAAGEIRADSARQMALMIYDLTRGSNARQLLGWMKEDRGREIDAICDFIWSGIRP